MLDAYWTGSKHSLEACSLLCTAKDMERRAQCQIILDLTCMPAYAGSIIHDDQSETERQGEQGAAQAKLDPHSSSHRLRGQELISQLEA